MDMLYKYRYVFSFRDEISMCQNIEVEIDVREKKDKATFDKEMRRLYYLGVIKEGF